MHTSSKTKPSRVLITGNFHYPSGTAPASRVRNLAAGLAEAGFGVTVVAMAPFSRCGGKSDPLLHGYSEGVEYYLTGGSRILGAIESAVSDEARMKGAARSAVWLFIFYLTIVHTIVLVFRLFLSHRYVLLWGYGRHASQLLPLYGIAKIFRVRTFLDIVETIEQFHGFGGRLSPIYWDWKIGLSLLPRMFDGLTVITHALEEVYRKKGIRRIMVLPSLEDFQNLPDISYAVGAKTKFNFVTMSSLIPRDNTELLKKLIREIGKRFPAVEFHLVGRYGRTSEGIKVATELATSLETGRFVVLHGDLDDKMVKELFLIADAFLLTRRSDYIEECAFPTRLVEYLRQGKPVFASDVGDINKYLRDGEEVFLMRGEDSLTLADEILKVMESPMFFQSVGEKGRMKASMVFDRKLQARRLMDFVFEIGNGSHDNLFSLTN